MFPGNFPVFLRASRFHDELIARELERARQVLADQGAHQCTLDVKSERVSCLIDFIGSKSGFVPAV